jgi:hypothetical protein
MFVKPTTCPRLIEEILKFYERQYFVLILYQTKNRFWAQSLTTGQRTERRETYCREEMPRD